MNDRVRTALRDLVQEQGESLLASREPVLGRLAEGFPGGSRELDALGVALDARVPSELRDYATAPEARMALEASAFRLQRGFGADPPTAVWAVLTLSNALGHISDEQFQSLLAELGGEPSVLGQEYSPVRQPPTPPTEGRAAPPADPSRAVPLPHPPPPPRPTRRAPPPRPAQAARRRPNAVGIFIAIAIAAFVVKFAVQSPTQDSPTRQSPRPAPTSSPSGDPAPTEVPPPPPPRTPSTEPSRRAVPGNIQEQKLIYQTNPDYPNLARTSRIEGVVSLSVRIAADGTVKKVELVSGHPLLAPAAMETVKQWRYRPTIVNGEPVEVLTRVDVEFKLNP